VLVLVPVIVLIVMVTRVAAAQREQRLATIRLVGATHLQTAVVAAAETGVAAVAGAVLAWVAYEAGRRILAATVTFQGGHFYLEDLAIPWWVLALLLGGAPLLVMLTTIASLHRVRVSPLGISRRAPGLIAARRIAADPYATFRVVSGVVLAAWAVTHIGGTADQLASSNVSEKDRLRPGVVRVMTGGVPAERIAPLLSEQTVVQGHNGQGRVVSCAKLSRVQDVSCPYGEGSGWVESGPGAENLVVVVVYVVTDGTLAAENRVRTQAANLVPNAIINSNRDLDHDLLYFTDLGRLAVVACLFALLVGACSLVAGMIAGLIERRRAFALLRASGVRLGELRRVVFIETVGTMVFTSALGVGLGLATSYIAARQSAVRWTWPDLDVFGYVGSGVLAAVIFSMLALPLLGAATRYDAVRYE
jgi:FtsX-like permease family